MSLPFKLTIARKGLILVLVPFVAHLSFILILALSNSARHAADRRVERSLGALDQSKNLLVALLNAETGIRGLVLVGTPEFSEPFELAEASVPATLTALASLVNDDPSQAARLEVIASKAQDFLKTHKDYASSMLTGQTTEAVARLKEGNGKKRMDELRSLLGDFESAEVSRQEDARARMRTTERRYSLILIIGTLLSLALTMFLGFVFSQSISGRLNTLMVNVLALSQGKSLAPPLGGSDEVSQLDQAFRSMSADLTAFHGKLIEQSSLLQSILQCMGDAVVVADVSGRFLVFNPAAERLFGPPEDGGAETWSDRYRIFREDETTPMPTAELPMVRALRGESADEIEMFSRSPHAPAGTWTRTSARPLLDAQGRLRGGVTVSRDVSESKRAEKALRESAEQVRDLYNNAPCGYHSVDADGLIVAINDTELRWLGYQRDEVVGKKRIADFLTAKSRECFPLHFRLLKELGAINNLEYDFVRKDGSTFPVLLNATSLRDAQGKFLISRATVFDATERKRAEEDIRHLNEDLERRVRERTGELAEANRELTHKNQEVETFVYSVSHDLRSPLVNLEGFSRELDLACRELRTILSDASLPEGVRERGLALVDQDVAESLRFIQAAVRRLSTIIDSLLRLSRAGRVEYTARRVDMNDLMNRIVQSLHASARGVDLRVGSLPALHGDPAALEQIFANLMDNAIKYLSPDRPGRIEVGEAEDREAGDEQKGMRTLFIKDNGLGIPEAYWKKVFQAFQRVHPGVAQGEGMGLAIVRRIVERHRGRIWLESTTGEGTTFFVSLPGGVD